LRRFRDAGLSAQRNWELIALLDAAARHGAPAAQMEHDLSSIPALE
jgi:hypothetical protein